MVTESFNEQGAVAGTNTSDYKTTLLDNDDDGVTLEMRVCVEVAESDSTANRKPLNRIITANNNHRA